MTSIYPYIQISIYLHDTDSQRPAKFVGDSEEVLDFVLNGSSPRAIADGTLIELQQTTIESRKPICLQQRGWSIIYM